jgi:hypothetical protein
MTCAFPPVHNVAKNVALIVTGPFLRVCGNITLRYVVEACSIINYLC